MERIGLAERRWSVLNRWGTGWEAIPALLFFVFAGWALVSQASEISFVADVTGIIGAVFGGVLFLFLMARTRNGGNYEASDYSDVDSGE
jgi:hypothetical protein